MPVRDLSQQIHPRVRLVVLEAFELEEVLCAVAEGVAGRRTDFVRAGFFGLVVTRECGCMDECVGE